MEDDAVPAETEVLGAAAWEPNGSVMDSMSAAAKFGLIDEETGKGFACRPKPCDEATSTENSSIGDERR
ncbi:hypothetical protein ACFOY4_01250 [Actinomadura syzygii]|uniref:Uncharacterized protein n=1 Tax=Actinomadura syzygii TaxID=1427538 RepID=A0A5D0TSD2_9ACTN|nr:hypothetical protein [Actinomadura syzygii]TYC08623.1 hypothetical protein FXF65_37665 [Actinomadura syzygii]